MDNGKHVGGMLLAFLAGGVLGAAAGLLLAPSSGAETRRKIKSTSLDARDKAMERVETAKDKAMEKVETAKSEAAGLVERGKGKVAGVKTQIQSAVEAGKDAYSRKKENMTSDE